MHLKSKEIIIAAPAEKVFGQIADCHHLKQGIGLANVPQMSNLECTDTTCSFQMAGLGSLVLTITDTTFPTRVVYDVKNEHIRSVTVYFDIETVPEGSRLVSSSDLDLPFFMSQMLKPVLLNFLNVLVDCVKTTTERDMGNDSSTLAINS